MWNIFLLIQAETESLTTKERRLDELIRWVFYLELEYIKEIVLPIWWNLQVSSSQMREKLRELTEDESNQK